MGDRLKGKVAIVTGSGRGIGRAEALALAAEGVKVMVSDLVIYAEPAVTQKITKEVIWKTS